MVYTLTNPVKGHLVAQSAEWPGATSLSAHLQGHEIRAYRPRRFFSPDGPMPEEVTIELTRPPGFETMKDDCFRGLLTERLEAIEQHLASERARDKVRVLGRKAVLRQNWFARPSTREPRRKLSPRIACKNTWRRIEALHRNKTFLAVYKEGRERLRAGLEAVLPAGTYWLRRFAGFPCEDYEPSARAAA